MSCSGREAEVLELQVGKMTETSLRELQPCTTRECRTSTWLQRRITRSLIERKQPTEKCPWFFCEPGPPNERPDDEKGASGRKKATPRQGWIREPRQRFIAQREASRRPHAKPLANICTVYVQRRELVSCTNIFLIHVHRTCVVEETTVETREPWTRNSNRNAARSANFLRSWNGNRLNYGPKTW